MSEDYVSLVGDIMYPRKEFGPYGYIPDKARVSALSILQSVQSLHQHMHACMQFPMDRINTLGFLLSPIRKPTVIGIVIFTCSDSSSDNASRQKNGVHMR
jgi:hypothetical protein